MSQRADLWPARHFASARTEPWLPPMGLRLRVTASFDIRVPDGIVRADRKRAHHGYVRLRMAAVQGATYRVRLN